MAEYIERAATVAITDYAEDEHPYDKDPKRPDTYSAYNEGWSAACDYIRGGLEGEPAADVEPVRHGRWLIAPLSIRKVKKTNIPEAVCTNCGERFCDIVNGVELYHFCPNCGAQMDGRLQHDDLHSR